MNAHAPRTIAESDVKAIAASLIPELRQRAMQTDRDRRVPPENIKLLADSGLLGIFRAKKWGGRDCPCAPMSMRFRRWPKAAGDRLGARRLSRARLHHRPHERARCRKRSTRPAPCQAVAAVIGPRGKAVRRVGRDLSAQRLLALRLGQCRRALAAARRGSVRRGRQQARRGRFRRADRGHRAHRRLACRGPCRHRLQFRARAGTPSFPAHRYISLPALLENQTATFARPDAPSVTSARPGRRSKCSSRRPRSARRVARSRSSSGSCRASASCIPRTSRTNGRRCRSRSARRPR